MPDGAAAAPGGNAQLNRMGLSRVIHILLNLSPLTTSGGVFLWALSVARGERGEGRAGARKYIRGNDN